MRNASNLRSTLVLSLVALVLPAFEPPAQNTQAQIQAPSSNVCSVEISSPNPGDKVGPSTTVKGLAQIPADGYSWILSRKKSMGNQWWPQAGGPVEIDESRHWEAEVFFGRPIDIGSTFEIAAVVVTRQTSQEMVNWFATAKALDYPPIPFPNSSGCRVVIIKVEKSR